MTGTHSNLTAEQAKEKALHVKHECTELKKSGAFRMGQVETFAEEVGPIFQDMWAGDFGTDHQLEHTLEELFALFFDIASDMEHCSEDQWPTYDKLSKVYQGLTELKKAKYTGDDVAKFQDQLREVDNARVDGKFLDAKGNVPKGQAMLITLLNKCYRLAHQMLVDLE